MCKESMLKNIEVLCTNIRVALYLRRTAVRQYFQFLCCTMTDDIGVLFIHDLVKPGLR